jgi:hypothetical protein
MKSTSPSPWSWTSSLQNFEKQISCVSHPVWGIWISLAHILWISEETDIHWAGGEVQVVELLPSKHEVLSSKPQYHEKKNVQETDIQSWICQRQMFTVIIGIPALLIYNQSWRLTWGPTWTNIQIQ